MAFIPFSFARSRIIDVLTTCQQEKVDIVPEGFNNNIRWNAGHVLVIADRILHHADRYAHTIPSHFETFFDMDTKPADWLEQPPTIAEIKDLSNQQIKAAKELFHTERDDPLHRPFNLRGTTFHTVAELIGFLTYHEGLHFQTMKLLQMKIL